MKKSVINCYEEVGMTIFNPGIVTKMDISSRLVEWNELPLAAKLIIGKIQGAIKGYHPFGKAQLAGETWSVKFRNKEFEADISFNYNKQFECLAAQIGEPEGQLTVAKDYKEIIKWFHKGFLKTKYERCVSGDSF